MRKLFIQKMLLTTVITLSSVPVSVYAAEDSSNETQLPKRLLGLYKAGEIDAHLASKGRELAAKESELKEKQGEIQSLRQQKATLEGSVGNLQQESTKRSRQIGELTSKVDTITREKSQVEEELRSLRAESSRLQNSNRQCEEEQHKRQEAMNDLEEELKEKQTELNKTSKKLKEAETALASAKEKVKSAERELAKCQEEEKSGVQDALTKEFIQAASLIAFKEGINQVANLSPYSAPTVLGVSVGSSRQVSEVVGHTLQAVYDKNQELNQFSKNDIRDIGTVAAKTFARELALSTLYRVGEKTGINGKVVNVYQNSRVPGFLENHTTTKAVVESASRLTVGALRLGTDVVLENLVWSNLPSGDSSSFDKD